jgi:hypothetical protein
LLDGSEYCEINREFFLRTAGRSAKPSQQFQGLAAEFPVRQSTEFIRPEQEI